ncbi:MAG TPA: DPP IV N-terminal domain-containing protein [Longilinea sp.]|nr:DPP IV N-terminal domain-containing protein [Longilinea sp.]
MKRFSPLVRIILIAVLALLVLANIALFLFQGLPLVTAPKATATASATPTASPTATIDISLLMEKNTPAPQEIQLPSQLLGLQQQGFFVLSMSDGPYYHLFAYNPQYLGFTRLTNNAWDDRDPAISPDGTKIAFSSHKSGYWDIYILDIATGETTQITKTPDYDGEPTWSSDGQWLAYVSDVDNNMDIYIQFLADLSQKAIQLTDDPTLDYSPSWSPNGRKIAFVSTRSGDPEIWIADLDKVTDRFTNISNMPGSIEQHPAWSPDGRYLAFASDANGVENLFTWDSQNPQQAATSFAAGDWPFWSANGDNLSALIEQPNQTYLATYRFADRLQVLPATTLPGTVSGADWETGSNINLLALYINNEIDTAPTPTLFQPIITLSPPPGGRYGVVALNDVNAPYTPYLQDSVDESFDSLRTAVGQLAGWDFLANLENAFLPLTEPPDPDTPENWLFTGRAIAVNTLPLSAKWMVIVREDFNGQSYWRIFLKARQQDGSQGLPLSRMIWDLDTRYSGNPVAYDDGGSLEAPPSGYWIDFTELALRYGWKRVPSLANWRTYYQGMLFNQYVFGDTMDWQTAMNQLYPPEALATYTPIPSITPTPTVTQTSTRTPTATRTKYVTRTPIASRTPTP